MRALIHLIESLRQARLERKLYRLATIAPPPPRQTRDEGGDGQVHGEVVRVPAGFAGEGVGLDHESLNKTIRERNNG